MPELEAGEPGQALGDPEQLILDVPLENVGVLPVSDVTVTSLSLGQARLLAPVGGPQVVGSILPDAAVLLRATFSLHDPGGGIALVGEGEYALRIEGTLRLGDGAPKPFSLGRPVIVIPTASAGTATTWSGRVQKHVATGDPSEPDPIPPDGYADTDENEGLPPVVNLCPGECPSIDVPEDAAVVESSALSLASEASGSANPRPTPGLRALYAAAGGSFSYDTAAAAANQSPYETSCAASTGLALYCFNSNSTFKIAASMDGGISWTRYSPNFLYPGAQAAFDQVVMYVPGKNLFFWLLERLTSTRDPPGRTSWTVAWASPEALKANFRTAWSYIQFFSDGDFNISGIIDFGDITATGSYLHLGGPWQTKDRQGRIGIRMPLDDFDPSSEYVRFEAPALTWYSALSMCSRYVQDSPTTAYVATHVGSCVIRLFAWSDSESAPRYVDVPLSTGIFGAGCWNASTLTAVDSSGTDWLTFGYKNPKYSIVGAWRAFDPGAGAVQQIWLAWTAGTYSKRPKSNIEFARLDMSVNPPVVRERTSLWSRTRDFAYPSIATNILGELGYVCACGNAGGFPSVGYGIRDGSGTVFISGANASGTRFGDYFGIRRDPYGVSFNASGYHLTWLNPSDKSKGVRTRYSFRTFGTLR